MATLAGQHLTEMDIAKMAADEGVTPREFLERLLTSQERHVRELLAERDQRYAERFAAQERAVSAAIEAADKATNKAESEAAEWRRGANEWRGAMGDRERNFLSRTEAAAENKRINEKIDGLENRVTRGEGKGVGTSSSLSIALAIVPIVVSIVGIILVLALNN